MWWKIYFWVYLIGCIIGLFYWLEFAPLGAHELVSLLIVLATVTALYAFVFKKKLLSSKQWQTVFQIIVFLFITVLIEIFFLPDFLNKISPFFKSKLKPSAQEILLSWLISLPTIYAMYKLSLKDPYSPVEVSPWGKLIKELVKFVTLLALVWELLSRLKILPEAFDLLKWAIKIRADHN